MGHPWRTSASRDSSGHIATKSKYQKNATGSDFAPFYTRIFRNIFNSTDACINITENIFSAFLKGNVNSIRGHEGPQTGVETYFYSFLNLGARWARVVNTTTRALYPRERNPVTIVHRGEFMPRQTRQLPRAVDLKGRLLSCQSY